MENAKIKPSKPTGDSGITDDTGLENNEEEITGRRLQDAITSKNPNRKLNLDRRVKPGDRRADTDPHYKGPARRISIDSRNTKDRRDKD